MKWQRLIKRVVNRIARPLGVEIVATDRLYPWQKGSAPGPGYHSAELPEGAVNRLRSGNSELAELQKRYAEFEREEGLSEGHPLWSGEHLREEDLLYFRGDNAWVWQLRGPNMNPLSYTLTYFYLKSIDRIGLLERFEEDEAFGAFTFTVDGKLISRDLLDSVSELTFLERHLGISDRPTFSVVDIGAGYGRLAHRFTSAFKNVEQYLCTDAIPSSTHVSRYYLEYRGANRAASIPFDEIDETLSRVRPELAINIHSFPECSLESISWWMSLLRSHSVRYFMLVPNSLDHGGAHLTTNRGEEFGSIIARAGYREIACDPKYADPQVQLYGINPATYYLFELSE